MALMPGAEWHGPVPWNSGDGDETPMEPADAIDEYWWLVEHIADGYFMGTISWQRNRRSGVSSQFVTSRTGRIAQLVDTHDRAWTQRAGNPRAISVENEGFTGQALTPEQVTANARIFAWVHLTHGIPLQVTDTPARKGLGHHSMGAETGANWGHDQCPGTRIKAQKPLIVRGALDIVYSLREDTDMRPYLMIKHANWSHVFALFGSGLTRHVGQGEWVALKGQLVPQVTTHDDSEIARIAEIAGIEWPPQPVA